MSLSYQYKFSNHDLKKIQNAERLEIGREYLPHPQSTREYGERRKFPQRNPGRSRRKQIWRIISLTEHFWWNDSVASKRKFFWPFYTFPWNDLQWKDWGIHPTLATLQEMSKYWGPGPRLQN